MMTTHVTAPPAVRAATLKDFRMRMRKGRDACKRQSHAYGLIYDAVTWTKEPVTDAMLDALAECAARIAWRSHDFGVDDFNLIRKRLIDAGFSTAPLASEERGMR